MKISLAILVLVFCLGNACLGGSPGIQYIRGQNGQIIGRVYYSGGTSYYRGVYNQNLGKYNSSNHRYYNNRGIPSATVR